MFGALAGKKTYIVAFLTIAYAIGGYLTGTVPVTDVVELLLGGGGLASLRNAIK